MTPKPDRNYWYALMEHAGFDAVMKDNCWHNHILRSPEDILKRIRRIAEIRRPGNRYEKLVALYMRDILRG